jgi:hypothetical protein
MSLSQGDLKKLSQVLSLVRRGKPLSNKLYVAVMNCTAFPKYITKRVATYHKSFETQSGGEDDVCHYLWPEDTHNSCVLHGKTTPIGQGAFGKVFENDDKTVTKHFIHTDETEHLIKHLKINLPGIFEKLKSYSVYLRLFEIESKKVLAYEMVKLTPIPIHRSVFSNVNAYTAFLKLFFSKIIEVHKVHGIIHCDMKLDNTMFITDFRSLYMVLQKNLKIIDFDGCMTKDSIREQLKQGYKFHPTTPIFAHPFLLEILFSGEIPVVVPSRLVNIEIFRNTIAGTITKVLDHELYHEKIFEKNTYDTVFPMLEELEKLDNDTLFTTLRFCDYYNMAMSLLIKTPGEHLESCINATCKLLNEVAQKLLKPSSGGRRRRKQLVGGANTPSNGSTSEKQYKVYELGGKHVVHIDKQKIIDDTDDYIHMDDFEITELSKVSLDL